MGVQWHLDTIFFCCCFLHIISMTNWAERESLLSFPPLPSPPDCPGLKCRSATHETIRQSYIWLEYEVGPPTWLYSEGGPRFPWLMPLPDWSKLPWLYGCWLKVPACFSDAPPANLEPPLCQLVSLKTNQMFPAHRTKLRNPKAWRERWETAIWNLGRNFSNTHLLWLSDHPKMI